MIGVMLAAGMGTRLMPLTKDIPKALLKINETTLLERMIKNCINADISKFIVLVGYNKDKVILRLIAGNGFASNWNLDYVKVNGETIGAAQSVDEKDFTATWELKSSDLVTTAAASKDGLFIDAFR